MRTIRENLEEAIGLLKTNVVLNHVKACELVYLDLSTIKNFPRNSLMALAYYQKYLVEKNQSIKKVGIIEKIFNLISSIFTKIKLVNIIKDCQKSDYGDGNKYLQDIFLLIRKAI